MLKRQLSRLLLPLLILQIFVGYFAIPASIVKASGTTYYVDNTITDTHVASATPDCTTYNPATFLCSGGTASAYATIADINAGSFNPGDSILFRDGDTFREQLTVPSSGSSGNPITFSNFGSGASPIISGSNLLSSGWTQSTSTTGTVLQTNMKLSTATSTAFVDFSGTGGVTLSSYIGDQIAICSVTSPSQCVSGYIKATGTGETYGSQLLSNTAFSNTTGVGTYDATVASVAGGQSGNALQVSVTSGNPLGLGSESFSTVTGALLKFTSYAEATTSSIAMRLIFQENGGSYNFLNENYFTSTSWTAPFSLYGTADMSSLTANFGVIGSTNVSTFDTASVSQVLTPSSTGVTIVSAPGGSTYNWTSNNMTSGLDDTSGYTYSITATAANVWQSSVTSQPNQVFFNGVLGTQESSPINISAPNQWAATANTLYIYSTTNPATAYTNPGIEVSQRNNAINLGSASYITFSGLDLKNANLDNIYLGTASANNSGIVINGLILEGAYRDGYSYNNAAVSGNVSGEIMENSIIRNNGGNGIDWGILNFNGLLVTQNTVYSNCQIPASISYCSGVYVSSQQAGGSGTIVSKNYIYNNGVSGDSLIQGLGAWMDTDTGILVDYNSVSGNWSNGLVIENNINSTVANNIAWNNGQ